MAIASKKTHVRKGDIVMAITGEDADGKKTGKVLHIFQAKGRAIVEGFNFVKKHMRKTQDNPQGGIVEKEASIHISNLRLYEAAAEDKGAKKAKSSKKAKS